jgi:CheY-like chemotaxis protein
MPVTVVALLLGTLKGELISPAGRDVLAGVQRSLLASLGLLDDLLEFARLQAGALHPHIAGVKIGPVLQSVVDTFGVEARQRGINLIVRPTELMTRSDPQLLGRVIRNLASNAIKFTRRGGVLIGARRRGQNIRIEIWDTGVGIAPKVQEKIFWEFVQGQEPPARSGEGSSGLGLGLAIVDRLCRLLDHQIGLRSRLGKGSMFWIEVPSVMSESPVHSDTGVTHVSLKPLPPNSHIALVENDVEIGGAFEKLLTNWGARVTWRRDALDLLDALTSDTPDFLIADWHVDGAIDGFELFDRLEDRLGRDIPGIILTGDYDIDRIMEINGKLRKVLFKPVLPDVLQAVLNTEMRTDPPNAGLPNQPLA